VRTTHAVLFDRLFDDASMYPPASLDVAEAVRLHARHTLSWYAEMVGPFVTNDGRVPRVAAEVRAAGVTGFGISLVVPGGLAELAAGLDSVRLRPELVLRAVEFPHDGQIRDDVLRSVSPLLTSAIVYLEVPVLSVTERTVHELKEAGLRLKLRTGGTHIDSFRSEGELARPIVMAAAERLAFKCTAGLHNAVRHRDANTGFEHHGFLNIALAARVAATTGSVSATAAMLGEKNPEALAYHVNDLDDAGRTAIRALFVSFGTCSVDEPIADLLALRLVRAE
jgi:hypothetical protein